MSLEYSIITYDSDVHKKKVIHLFNRIYPNWTQDECKRMGYEAERSDHALSLLVVYKHQLIGQLNVFGVCNDCSLGNIGYHIHPEWQRQGVGSALMKNALLCLGKYYDDGLVIQTTIDNVAAINLAGKFGFSDAPVKMIEKYTRHLKFLSVGGVCVYIMLTKCERKPCNLITKPDRLRISTRANQNIED